MDWASFALSALIVLSIARLTSLSLMKKVFCLFQKDGSLL